MSLSRNVIVYLAQVRHSTYGTDAFARLNRSLALLQENYNCSNCNDPVLIFFTAGELTAEHQGSLLNAQASGRRTIRFHELPTDCRTGEVQPFCWRLPEWLNHSQPRRWQLWPRYSLGYRHMTRFFSVGIWPLLASLGYEYVWRLDDDAEILSPIKRNMFAQLTAHGYEYAARQASYGGPYPGSTLFHAFVREYLVTHSISPTWLLDPCSHPRNVSLFDEAHCGRRYFFYTNLCVTRVSFWLSDPVASFLWNVDRSGLLYTKRYAVTQV